MPHQRCCGRGFERGADDYERARPGYPPGGVRPAGRRAPAPAAARRVLDLAAGTGKFTRGLLGAGADRRGGRAGRTPCGDELAVGVPEVEIARRHGRGHPARPTARSTWCASAQAFHWFDARPALAEIAPRAATRWRARARCGTSATSRSTGCTSSPSSSSSGRVGVRTRRTTDLAAATRRPWTSALPWWARSGGSPRSGTPPSPTPSPSTSTACVDRAASTSFVSALPDDRREALLAEVRQLVETHPQTAGRERFDFPHRTDVHLVPHRLTCPPRRRRRAGERRRCCWPGSRRRAATCRGAAPATRGRCS